MHHRKKHWKQEIIPVNPFFDNYFNLNWTSNFQLSKEIKPLKTFVKLGTKNVEKSSHIQHI